MSDERDERGGDESATPFETAERILAKCRKRRLATVADVEILSSLVVELVLSEAADEAEEKLLAAVARAESATVLPERWRALIAERDEARELARVSLDILRNVSDEPMRELFEVDDMDELPDWFTGYGKPSAAEAPDAAPDGQSATETVEDGVQASGSELEFEGRSAELSECCRATKLNDGIRHRCDSDSSGPHTHECGDCAHRWSDDTTEDDRG